MRDDKEDIEVFVLPYDSDEPYEEWGHKQCSNQCYIATVPGERYKLTVRVGDTFPWKKLHTVRIECEIDSVYVDWFWWDEDKVPEDGEVFQEVDSLGHRAADCSDERVGLFFPRRHNATAACQPSTIKVTIQQGIADYDVADNNSSIWERGKPPAENSHTTELKRVGACTSEVQIYSLVPAAGKPGKATVFTFRYAPRAYLESLRGLIPDIPNKVTGKAMRPRTRASLCDVVASQSPQASGCTQPTSEASACHGQEDAACPDQDDDEPGLFRRGRDAESENLYSVTPSVGDRSTSISERSRSSTAVSTVDEQQWTRPYNQGNEENMDVPPFPENPFQVATPGGAVPLTAPMGTAEKERRCISCGNIQGISEFVPLRGNNPVRRCLFCRDFVLNPTTGRARKKTAAEKTVPTAPSPTPPVPTTPGPPPTNSAPSREASVNKMLAKCIPARQTSTDTNAGSDDNAGPSDNSAPKDRAVPSGSAETDDKLKNVSSSQASAEPRRNNERDVFEIEALRGYNSIPICVSCHDLAQKTSAGHACKRTAAEMAEPGPPMPAFSTPSATSPPAGRLTRPVQTNKDPKGKMPAKRMPTRETPASTNAGPSGSPVSAPNDGAVPSKYARVDDDIEIIFSQPVPKRVKTERTGYGTDEEDKKSVLAGMSTGGRSVGRSAKEKERARLRRELEEVLKQQLIDLGD